MSYLRRCMANDDIFDQVEGLFEAYLEQNGHRKTPERFAILRQVYSYDGHFDVDTMYDVMAKTDLENLCTTASVGKGKRKP